MKAIKRKKISLIMILMLLAACTFGGCASNHPIEESKLPKLEKQAEEQKQDQQQELQQQPQTQQQEQQQQSQPEPQQQQEQSQPQQDKSSSSNKSSDSSGGSSGKTDSSSGSGSSSGGASGAGSAGASEGSSGGGSSEAPVTEALISESEAIAIALGRVPGANESHVASFGKDYDDGRWIYEGEIRYNGLEYEFEIDAQTGNILEWEIDD